MLELLLHHCQAMSPIGLKATTEVICELLQRASIAVVWEFGMCKLLPLLPLHVLDSQRGMYLAELLPCHKA
eukprot:4595066-Amphidinium_carterae.1